MTDNPQPLVDWHRAAPNAVALVILPWQDKGFTITKRDRTGKLHGCRDVTGGTSDTSRILAAWVGDAIASGLAVEDYARALDLLPTRKAAA